MQIFLSNDGSIEFLDGSTINRNTINRKRLEVTLESALTEYESLWVQFGKTQNFDEVGAEVLEPIRFEKVEGSANKFIKLIPSEVTKSPGRWYMVLAVRKYSPRESSVFTEQLTSDQESFTVNDNFPVPDDGYVSNATMESIYHDTVTAATSAIKAQEICEESAEKVEGFWNNFQGLFVSDNETTAVKYTIENNVDKSFKANVESVELTIPKDITHGFQSGVNIKGGESDISCNIVNNSDYEVKYVKNGYGTDSIDTLTANHNSVFSFFCDGIAVYCILAEV
ncbi:MAG: hypothetical protein ACI4MN_06020 [Candidatus Coproplasma sp.]